MPGTISKVAKWFGLEVVHVIIVRRSHHGDLRLVQSTFPSDHPTVGLLLAFEISTKFFKNITLTLEEEEASSSKKGIEW